MAGAQREETQARLAGTGMASARSRVRRAALFAFILLTSLATRAQAEPASPAARVTADAGNKPTAIPKRQPGAKTPTRKTASEKPRPGLRRSRRKAVSAASAASTASTASTDRAVAPAPFVPAVAPTPVAPPEKQVIPLLPRAGESAPAPKPAPAPRPEPIHAQRDAGTQETVTKIEPPTPAREPLDAGTQETAPRPETGAPAQEQSDASSEAHAPSTPPAEAEKRRPSEIRHPPSSPPPTPAPSAKAPPRRTRATRTPPPPRNPTAPAENKTEPITLDIDLFDKIRLEIKGRLPYFQACADAARRRGSPDVRRVQATWCVAADGVIKELRLEGVRDPRLVSCITRMGNRPFEVKPGVELTIPTPIVFVR